MRSGDFVNTHDAFAAALCRADRTVLNVLARC